jgi:membrane-associated protein
MPSWPDAAGFLIAHGSVLILPLAVIEGPLVSVVAGFLSATGYVDWYWALLLLVCGDLIGDFIYYWVGRTGWTPVAALGRRCGMRPVLSADLKHGLTSNATKMLCIGKWTHSVGGLVLLGAGMLRVPLLKFMVVNLLATLPKSAVLFGVGYFAWAYYVRLEDHLIIGSIGLFLVGLTGIVVILRYGGRISADEVGR